MDKSLTGRGFAQVLRVVGILGVLALVSAPAHAFVVDTFLDATNDVGSGDPAELGHLADLIGADADDLEIISKQDRAIQVDTSFDPDQYFINVAAETPSYFILKFGNGNTGGPGTRLPFESYYFANVGELTHLVFTLAQLGAAGATTFSGLNGVLSHVTSVVPIPGAAVLFGSALIGLGWFRRRHRGEAPEGVAA